MRDTYSSDVRDFVLEHGEWLHGGYPEQTIAEWLDTKLPVSRMEEWVRAGCFEPTCAVELEAHGLDPADVARCDYEDMRLGYAFANHIVSTAEVVRRVKEN